MEGLAGLIALLGHASKVFSYFRGRLVPVYAQYAMERNGFHAHFAEWMGDLLGKYTGIAVCLECGSVTLRDACVGSMRLARARNAEGGAEHGHGAGSQSGGAVVWA